LQYFRIPLCQLTDQRSVVGERRGKLRREEGRNEGEKERERDRKKGRKKGRKNERKEKLYLLTQAVKLETLRTDM
jgi:hypothetical protein